MDIICGKTWTFGENIDTDVIIPGRYLRTFNPQDLADHVLEGERPDFTKNVKKGDIVGKVVYRLNEKNIGECNIIVVQDIDKIGFFNMERYILNKWFNVLR